jgi:hypothetical protein
MYFTFLCSRVGEAVTNRTVLWSGKVFKAQSRYKEIYLVGQDMNWMDMTLGLAQLHAAIGVSVAVPSASNSRDFVR